MFVGGCFNYSAGNLSNVAGYNPSGPSRWTPVGDGFNDCVFALAYNPDQHALYAGGLFTASGSTPITYLGQFNLSAAEGAWMDMGSNYSCLVATLLYDAAHKVLHIGGLLDFNLPVGTETEPNAMLYQIYDTINNTYYQPSNYRAAADAVYNRSVVLTIAQNPLQSNLVYVGGFWLDGIYGPPFGNGSANWLGLGFALGIIVVDMTVNEFSFFDTQQAVSLTDNTFNTIYSLTFDTSTGYLYGLGSIDGVTPNISSPTDNVFGVFGYNGTSLFSIDGITDYFSASIEGPVVVQASWLSTYRLGASIAVDPYTHYVYTLIGGVYGTNPALNYLVDPYGNIMSGLMVFDGIDWSTLIMDDLDNNEAERINSIYFATGRDFNGSLVLIGAFDSLVTTNPSNNALASPVKKKPCTF